jgi:Cytochrome c554 and c-prime
MAGLGVMTILSLVGRIPARADELPTFVGAQACAGCHAAEFDAWKGSHHALAMQKATEAAVLGDFAGAPLEHFGVTTRFFRDGDKFMARTDGPDGALHEYPIAYTFGVYPLQQYLIAFPGGRLQALGIAWDSRPKDDGGQHWFHLYPDQNLKSGDRLHWTGRDQTWNYQCADCHSTDLKKNYDLTANTYATSWTISTSPARRATGPGRTVDDLAVPVERWVWRPRIDPCPHRRRPGGSQGARAELGPPLQAHPAPAQRGALPPRPGRNPHQHRPQLQRPPEYDIKAYGVKEDAALPEDAGTAFVR